MERRSKLTLGIAAAALAACGLAYALDVGPPEATQIVPVPTRMQCVGLNCGGNGGPQPRGWSYMVYPAGSGVARVDIGIHFPIAWISQVVMPQFWSVQVLPDAIPDDPTFTAHGGITAPTGICNYVLRFTGPAQTQPFQLGYGGGQGVHDVEWDTGTAGGAVNGVANWSRPVGQNYGPVHSPVFGPIPVEPVPPAGPAEAADAEPHAH